MAIINAPQPGEAESKFTNGIETLPDFDPIHVVLDEVESFDNSKYAERDKNGNIIKDGRRLRLKYVTQDGKDTWIFEYLSFRLGETKDHKPAALRSILNTSVGRSENMPIDRIDDETLEFFYEDEDGVEQRGQLHSGVHMLIRGQKGRREDKDGNIKPTFKIMTRQAMPQSESTKEVVAAANAAFPSKSLDESDF